MTRNKEEDQSDDAGSTADIDEALILRVRTGDGEAFALLYQRHIGSATATARLSARNPSDVSDLVAEAFANVLAAIRKGNGPEVHFRAYLLATLRRLAKTKNIADEKNVLMDDLEPVAGALAHTNPALAAFEKEVVGKSFNDLPQRWQEVLWYTEIAGMTPAEIGPKLGISANAVAALALRAREGLKQSYLQNHISTSEAGCRDYARHLGAYVRRGLTRRRTQKVDAHLRDCLHCTAILLHLDDVGTGLRAVIFPAAMGISLLNAEAGLSSSWLALSGTGTGKVVAGGTYAASATAGVASSAGAWTVVSAAALVLVAATIGTAVLGTSTDAADGSDPLAPPYSAVSTSPIGPASLAPSEPGSLASIEAKQLDIKSLVPEVPVSETSQIMQPPASFGPTLPDPSGSTQPEPGGTPSPSTKPTPSPLPTETPSPPMEGKEISVTSAVVLWGFPSAIIRVSLSHTYPEDLNNVVVGFRMSRYWLDSTYSTHGSEIWECADAAGDLWGKGTCTAASWAQGTAEFDLTVPTSNILRGYPLRISVSAQGTPDFATTIVLRKSD